MIFFFYKIEICITDKDHVFVISNSKKKMPEKCSIVSKIIHTIHMITHKNACLYKNTFDIIQ